MAPISNDFISSSAPEDWTEDSARNVATAEGLTLTDDHLNVLHALQEYYSHHELSRINVRELHDALDEKFHHKGGIKYMYSLFPGGPVAQGCRLAGLQLPAGAIDKGGFFNSPNIENPLWTAGFLCRLMFDCDVLSRRIMRYFVNFALPSRAYQFQDMNIKLRQVELRHVV